MTEIFKIAISVLGYREDDKWVALALEMDLRGYGDTFQESLEELQNLVYMQLSFAIQKEQMDLINHPADAVWFNLFSEIRREELSSIEADVNEDYRIAGIGLPAAHEIASYNNANNAEFTMNG